MQTAPSIPADFLATSPPAGGAGTGSVTSTEGVFASHLAGETTKIQQTQIATTSTKPGNTESQTAPFPQEATTQTEGPQLAQVQPDVIEKDGGNNTVLLHLLDSIIDTDLSGPDSFAGTLSSGMVQPFQPLRNGTDGKQTAQIFFPDQQNTSQIFPNRQQVVTGQQQVVAGQQQIVAGQQQVVPQELELLFQQQSAKNMPQVANTAELTSKENVLIPTKVMTPLPVASASQAKSSVSVASSLTTNVQIPVSPTGYTPVNDLGNMGKGTQSHINTPDTIIIDNWSASYSRHDNVASTKEGQVALLNGKQNVDASVAEAQIQRITVLQSDKQEEVITKSSPFSNTLVKDSSGQRQDANSNFIHSNMPSGSVKAGFGENQSKQFNNQEQQNNADKQLQQPSQIQSQQTAVNREGVPLVFSLESQTQGATSTNSLTGDTASLFRMPSGLQVPSNTVAEQVANHFSTSSKLESGTITLRLHPQELGELRMEIKVEQDNIKAHITTQNPQAQEMLDRHLPKLRESLEQQGLRLELVEVTVAANDNSDKQLFQGNKQNAFRQSFKHQHSVGTFNEAESDEPLIESDTTSLNVLA